MTVIRLGRDEYGEEVIINLHAEAVHFAIQGMTRSGKSVASYNVLAQLANDPTVRIVGCDPTGLLLRPWMEATVGEPWIALGQNNMADHLSVLDAVKTESDRRIASMWNRELDSLGPKQLSEAEPLIVLVLEEYPGILEAAADQDSESGAKPADRLEPKIARRVRSLVAQSAKAGIRVVLLAQRFEASIISGATRSNFAARLTMRVDNGDSVRMLHPAATPEECEAATRLAPGVGIYEAPGRPRRLIRSDFVPDYGDYLRHCRAALGRRDCSA